MVTVIRARNDRAIVEGNIMDRSVSSRSVPSRFARRSVRFAAALVRCGAAGALTVGVVAVSAPVSAIAWSDPHLAAGAPLPVVSLHVSFGPVDRTWIAGDQFCSGTLIAPRWVLTAAHCTEPADAVDVVVGVHLPDHTQYVRATRFRVASDYAGLGYINGTDLALVELERPLRIEPMALPTGDDAAWRAELAVYGFGLDPDGFNGRIGAAQVFEDDVWVARRVPLRPGAQLGVFGVHHELLDGVPVAVRHSAACFGDSGGPVVGTAADGSRAVVGVVSYVSGSVCGPAGEGATVAVRVAAHLDWIVPIVSR